MGLLARDSGVPWSLQPDWKILEAALLYEDAALMETTNDKNFLRYLREDLGAVIDPHSHENYGYNYTDVAHLLDSLGVGATTVIGGHIWDPELPQFQEWDRFRVPVPGVRYPWALWPGDILMGSGTPNHVNDPVVSGVWRPRDRDHYFEHDSTANIAAVGQYRGTLDDTPELIDLYRSGAVPTQFMLTSSYHIRPATITRPGAIADIEDSVITPVLTMRDSGVLTPTDFTSLVQAWQTSFGSRGFLYDAESPSEARSDGAARGAVITLDPCSSNPFIAGTRVRFAVARPARIRLAIFDLLGREVAVLVDATQAPGGYTATWDASAMPAGTYLLQIKARETDGTGKASVLNGKLVSLR